MKILMVLDHEFPSDIRVEKEIQTLISVGNTVDLACFTRKNASLYDQSLGYNVYRKPISEFMLKTSVGALKFPFYFNFWNNFLDKLLKKGNYQAIHVHDLPLAKVGHELSRKYNIKFVLDLHENWPVLKALSPHTKTLLGRFLHSNNQWLNYEKKYASLADALIVVADEMKDRLLKRGVTNNNIFVVPNTTDTDIYDDFSDISPDSDYFTLIYTGGINKHRGIEIVIEGMHKMKLENNFRFWIVGTGKNEPNLMKLVEKLNLKKYVHFFGWKSQKEVYELILKSDVTVIPHLKNEHSDNTSPNKIFHYMLAKKPVLVSNCNYLKNIVDESDCGLVYEYSSPDAFADKLKILMVNTSKRDYYGINGYNSVIEKYNWDNTSKGLIKIYEK